MAKKTPTRSSSTPAARGGGRPAGRPGVYVATPKSDIYVTMLGIALGAMILASLLLALVWGRYEWKIYP